MFSCDVFYSRIISRWQTAVTQPRQQRSARALQSSFQCKQDAAETQPEELDLVVIQHVTAGAGRRVTFYTPTLLTRRSHVF